ncbi:MAG: DUF3489 domain-containing protein [Rhodospirillales bacterium]|nr:MAG: DUF3489 domain-containing protein [Rhodospirillales bacterium]
MPKLSDTQLVILSAACQRDDRLILPLPDRLKGGAAAKVVESLAAKGLIAEVDAKRGDPIWREAGDGHGITLVATDAALEALGIEPDDAPAGGTAGTDETAGTEATEPAEPAPVSTTAAPARKTREGSKQAQLIGMLKRPEGASIEEIVAAFGWQAHTVRGAIAGALKKKLGLDVTSGKVEGRGRVYRIAD